MFANLDLQQLLFGRFTIEQIPYHEPILQATFAGMHAASIRCNFRVSNAKGTMALTAAVM